MNFINNPDNSSGHYWYVIQSVNGKEKLVAETLSSKIIAENLSDSVSAIRVIEETIQENRKGRIVSKTRSKFSGYFYIKAHLSTELKNLLLDGLNDPKTGRFLFTKFPGLTNRKNQVFPLPKNEVLRLGLESTKVDSKTIVEPLFSINDMVRIIDGPFNSYVGKLKTIDTTHNSAEVEFSIFGRPQKVTIAITSLISA